MPMHVRVDGERGSLHVKQQTAGRGFDADAGQFGQFVDDGAVGGDFEIPVHGQWIVCDTLDLGVFLKGREVGCCCDVCWFACFFFFEKGVSSLDIYSGLAGVLSSKEQTYSAP